MVAVRTVVADRKLPHQLVVRVRNDLRITVSCNCRMRHGRPIMGILPSGGSAFELYQRAEHDLRDGPLDRLVTGERMDYRVP